MTPGDEGGTVGCGLYAINQGFLEPEIEEEIVVGRHIFEKEHTGGK